MTPPRYEHALAAVADLMGRLRLAHAFVGGAARAAWLGGALDQGAVDVLVLMTSEQKNQVATMASHRGFRVDQEEVDATVEYDLVPLNFLHPEGDVKVHVLVASNALYGQMVAAARDATLAGHSLRVIAPEDLALLLSLGDDEASQRDRERLAALPAFDRRKFNQRAAAIGLAGMVIAE